MEKAMGRLTVEFQGRNLLGFSGTPESIAALKAAVFVAIEKALLERGNINISELGRYLARSYDRWHDEVSLEEVERISI